MCGTLGDAIKRFWLHWSLMPLCMHLSSRLMHQPVNKSSIRVSEQVPVSDIQPAKHQHNHSSEGIT